MKRPEKIVKWLHVDKKSRKPFVNHNGKPLFDYVIRLPYWIAQAYKPNNVRVEIREKTPCFSDRYDEEKQYGADEYVKKNWSAKLSKLRKLNHNFILIGCEGKGRRWFKSMEDYENYHKELEELNRKYGLVTSE